MYQYHITTCLPILVEKNEFKHRHGIPWIIICLLMEFHGISSSGDLCNSMDIHAHTAGIPWNSSFWWFVKFHGIPDKASWKSMELQPFMICGIPWNSRLGELEIHGIPWRCLNSFFSTRIAKQVLIWYWYIVQSMLQRMRYEPSQSAIVGVRKLVPSPFTRKNIKKA